ncbi:MAG: AAA family ATPase [Thermoanaerobaculia bacterium]
MTHTAEFEPDGKFEIGRARYPRPAERVHGKSRQRLDTDCLIDEIRPLAESLRRRVSGQEEAIESLVCSSSRLLSGLRDASRPLMTSLLLGPTGVGKTETAKALAQALFGSERAMTRVNCEEYAHGHEISKLLGSPPGYVGHQIDPLLSQYRLDQPHRRLIEARSKGETLEIGLADRIFSSSSDALVSVILFDEIEKAHPTLWNALLGILEDGMLTLGNNDTTDFTLSVILMTSNVGSAEMGEFLDRRPVGFGREHPSGSAGAENLRELALKAARSRFPFEFLNRFDEVLVYSALERIDLEKIFEKFLADVHDRALKQAGVPILIRPSAEAKEWIIERGTNLRFGARPLRRAIERELVDPLSRLIASEGIAAGDVVEVEVEGETLAFYRRRRAAGAGAIVA